MQAHVTPYRLPFHRPLRTATTLRVVREGFWLELAWPGGQRGVGEAAGWPGFGAGEPAVAAAVPAVQALLRTLGAAVAPPPARQDAPSAAVHAWVAATLADWAAAGGQALPLEWRGGLECALWDAAARVQQVPMARLLAPGAPLRVPVHVQVRSASEAARAVAAGARHLKIKVGHRSRDDDGAHVAGVRSAVGEAVGLRLDANGAWEAHSAERFARMVAAISPEWLEQPVRAGSAEDLARVRRDGAVRVAVDEGLGAPEAIAAHLAADAADVYVLKPMMLGGPLATLSAARRIADGGRDICVTHAMESPWGSDACLQVAAAVMAHVPVGRVRAAGLLPMVGGTPPVGEAPAVLEVGEPLQLPRADA